ncbi:MAG: VOC family protein [Proteobacteria bacterium]|nr:VOC family protein [Pseudomonadota bacterium]
MQINGIAHVQLTVTNFKVCVDFYEKLLEYFEMKRLIKTDSVLYYIGGRTGIAISKCDEQFQNEHFEQRRIGLHHLCFRTRRREDVDELYRFLQSIDTTIVHPPEDGPWAPGYYSVLFEDPDGIRLEANYVPGKGHLEPTATIGPAGPLGGKAGL